MSFADDRGGLPRGYPQRLRWQMVSNVGEIHPGSMIRLIEDYDYHGAKLPDHMHGKEFRVPHCYITDTEYTAKVHDAPIEEIPNESIVIVVDESLNTVEGRPSYGLLLDTIELVEPVESIESAEPVEPAKEP